ncbi:ADP-ribosylglycohydrolase family protein [Vibrio mediterranei]|uniref:ADP-ribosylglycohydrolase family protein n=1 Tax=Vibrio mediterranei TaxID=689 RepID=UPI00148D52BA|nr:ADP-ribosylglycohydrolase family protein [Vibrio mediterranei]NOH31216.1 ADP-ribosylglycohydrolase family protein [Vibrio mediterranei]
MKNTPTLYQRIEGCLIGQAYGDSLGMPSELWPQSKVKSHFGWIDTFLDGPEENIAANEFKRGQFTDDTAQALTMLDAIFEGEGSIRPKVIARHIMAWAKRIDAFNKNILGPTSKHSLQAIEKGEDLDSIESNGVTNGSAMRVAPIGCILNTENIDYFIEQVRQSCIATHKSDIAIAGSVAVAFATSRATQGVEWKDILVELPDIVDIAQTRYESTFSPKLSHRILYAIDCVEQIRESFTGKPEKYQQTICEALYQKVGAGMDIIESVPTALALVHASNTNPIQCAVLAANLGGDTDTIGAMACAICGALNGSLVFPKEDIDLLVNANQISFTEYAETIMTIR